MSKSKLVLIAVCLVIVAAVISRGLFSSGKSGGSDGDSAPTERRERDEVVVGAPAEPVGTGVTTMPRTEAPADTTSTVDDQVSVDAILLDTSLDIPTAATALRDMARNTSVKEEERIDALLHMLNLSEDDDNALAMSLLESPRLPDALTEKIMDDALNRPFGWQADVCLGVLAQAHGKELQARALEHLAFLTDENHGNDLKAWKLAVDKHRPVWTEDGR